MAWLPLLLALLAWLWARMQRFGPLLPPPAAERRSLLEHIVASGEHSYRYGYAHLLHAAVRDAFLARLRRRDPQAAALEGEPQCRCSPNASGPARRPRSRDALSAPVARDHAAFRTRIATLIRLHNTTMSDADAHERRRRHTPARPDHRRRAGRNAPPRSATRSARPSSARRQCSTRC